MKGRREIGHKIGGGNVEDRYVCKFNYYLYADDFLIFQPRYLKSAISIFPSGYLVSGYFTKAFQTQHVKTELREFHHRPLKQALGMCRVSILDFDNS